MTRDEEQMPPKPVEAQALPPIRMSSQQKAMLWSRVEASTVTALAQAEGEHQIPAEPQPSLVPQAGFTPLVIKLGVAAFVTGIAVGAAVDRFAFPPEPQVIERVVVRTEEVRVEIPVPVPAPVPSPVTPPKTERRRPEPKPTIPTPSAPEITVPSTNVERQLVEGARTALVRRDANSALQTLAKLKQDFPTGQLTEERDSLEVQALQQAGREDDAKAAAKAFLDRYPRSVFGPSIETILHGRK